MKAREVVSFGPRLLVMVERVVFGFDSDSFAKTRRQTLVKFEMSSATRFVCA